MRRSRGREGLGHGGLSDAVPVPAALDGVDGGPDAVLGQLPAVAGQPADQLELEPLVDVPGAVVTVQGVGSQGQ